ncbi:hypothetical protein A9255_07980 [Xenorhabdus hominickii]|uniref:Uncharacterized protein n=1 Tax=Xenorhabdus hominickii TaxID=351679 RepID=A0A2G0QBD9_XENHO|nr:hypothetical protein A9255_07980 [Xenorhabdus hominickii]PHM56526.1 hypothetical protein Xhom_02019 [Xenorhabdus hominickii]
MYGIINECIILYALDLYYYNFLLLVCFRFSGIAFYIYAIQSKNRKNIIINICCINDIPINIGIFILV